MKKILITCGLVIAMSGLFENPLDSEHKDKIYLEKIHSYKNEVVDKNTNSSLLGMAKEMCLDFEKGYTIEKIIKERLVDKTEKSRLLFGFVATIGTETFCPKYRSQVDRLAW